MYANVCTLYRVPKEATVRQTWIESISKANGKSFDGHGSICFLHFRSNEIRQISKNQVKLLPGTIPSKFPDVPLPIIHEEYESDGNDVKCKSCDGANAALFKVEADLNIQIADANAKLAAAYELNTSKSIEIRSLKTKLSDSQTKVKDLEGVIKKLNEQLVFEQNVRKLDPF